MTKHQCLDLAVIGNSNIAALIDKTGTIEQGAAGRYKPLVEIDRQEPAISVNRQALAFPAAPLQRAGESRRGIDIVGVAFDVGQ